MNSLALTALRIRGCVTVTVAGMVLLTVCGCGGGRKPPMAPAYPVPESRMEITRAEFKRRYEKLDAPAPGSRIEFLFGLPRARRDLAGFGLPFLWSYRCMDGVVHVAFGGAEEKYGAIEIRDGDLDEQEVFRPEFFAQIEELPATIDVETLHRWIEIDQPDRDAANTLARKSKIAAGIIDQVDLRLVDVERIRENVTGIEPDFLDFLEAELGVPARLGKR